MGGRHVSRSRMELYCVQPTITQIIFPIYYDILASLNTTPFRFLTVLLRTDILCHTKALH